MWVPVPRDVHSRVAPRRSCQTHRVSPVWEPDSGLVTGDGVVLDLPVARLPTRMLSYGIDLAVMVAVAAALVLGASVVVGDVSDSTGAALTIVGLVAVFLGYPVAFDTLNRGRTLGKMALGLRTVRDDGGAITFGQALVRGVAGLVDFPLTSWVGALVSAATSGQDKRLGDRLAGTFVIRERAPGGQRRRRRDTQAPAAMGSWAARSDLVGLDDVLASRVRSYLDRRAQLSPEADARLGHQLAAAVATHVTPPPPGTPPADYLAAVLAGRRR